MRKEAGGRRIETILVSWLALFFLFAALAPGLTASAQEAEKGTEKGKTRTAYFFFNNPCASCHEEDKIYENHVQKLIDYEHLELEKQKYALEDRKAYLTLQLEERKIQLEERKAELLSQQEIKHTKNDMTKFWVSSGINLIRILSSIFLGITSLRYNLKFGSLQDRDMQHWLKELFKRE